MKPALLASGVVLILAVLAAWLLRWQVSAAATEETATAYLLDRWTGNLYAVAEGEAVLQKKVEQSSRPKREEEGTGKEKAGKEKGKE